MGPSRADASDSWGADRKSMPSDDRGRGGFGGGGGGGFREREGGFGGGGGFRDRSRWAGGGRAWCRGVPSVCACHGLHAGWREQARQAAGQQLERCSGAGVVDAAACRRYSMLQPCSLRCCAFVSSPACVPLQLFVSPVRDGRLWAPSGTTAATLPQAPYPPSTHCPLRPREGGFGDGPSRADEVDNWGTKKSFVPSSSTRGGFEDRPRAGGFGGSFRDRSPGAARDRSPGGFREPSKADTEERWGR